MFKNLALLTSVISLSACIMAGSGYPVSQAQFEQDAATSRAEAQQMVAQASMNTTVCVAKANASVPHAADIDRPRTLKDRARLIEWGNAFDTCTTERGGPPPKSPRPSMTVVKICDQNGRQAMPGATSDQQNDYIDDCLKIRGFSPW